MASIVYFADGKQFPVDDVVVHCLVCDEWYEDGVEHVCPVRVRGPVDDNAEVVLKRIIGGTIYGVDVIAKDLNALVLAAYHLGRSDEYTGMKDRLWYYKKGQ